MDGMTGKDLENLEINAPKQRGYLNFLKKLEKMVSERQLLLLSTSSSLCCLDSSLACK